MATPNQVLVVGRSQSTKCPSDRPFPPVPISVCPLKNSVQTWLKTLSMCAWAVLLIVSMSFTRSWIVWCLVLNLKNVYASFCVKSKFKFSLGWYVPRVVLSCHFGMGGALLFNV